MCLKVKVKEYSASGTYKNPFCFRAPRMIEFTNFAVNQVNHHVKVQNLHPHGHPYLYDIGC